MRYLEENGDPVMYANLPFLADKLPGGKTWIRLDLEQAGQKLGVDLNQLLSQADQNPGQILDLLRASGSVETIGTETVDGASTTHYKATIELDKVAGEARRHRGPGVVRPAELAGRARVDPGRRLDRRRRPRPPRGARRAVTCRRPDGRREAAARHQRLRHTRHGDGAAF